MITRNLWHRKTTFRLWVFFNWISDLISYLLIFFVCFLEHLIHCCTVVFQYHSLIILTVTKYLILIKLTISTKKIFHHILLLISGLTKRNLKIKKILKNFKDPGFFKKLRDNFYPFPFLYLLHKFQNDWCWVESQFKMIDF